jgi:hypothetical protein
MARRPPPEYEGLIHVNLRRIRTGASVAAAVITVLGVTACGDDSGNGDSSSDDETTTAAAGDPAEPAPAAPSDTETATTTEPAATGGQPVWALPVTQPGTLISTVKAGDVTVEIYQVGTAKATDDGNFVDPDTNKPILAKGDELVFINYVVTNNGKPLELGSSLVDVTPKYDDWKWLQGMDGLTDEALFEAQDVNEFEKAPGGFNEGGVYTFGTGEQFSYGENFKHQKNSPITFAVDFTPVDAEGELLHDERVEAEGKGTIS